MGFYRDNGKENGDWQVQNSNLQACELLNARSQGGSISTARTPRTPAGDGLHSQVFTD